MSVSSRERLFTAISHKKPDRTPICLWLRGETERLLLSHFKTDSMDDVYVELGVDWCQRVYTPMTAPHFEGKETKILPGDVPGAGRNYIFNDDGSFEDGWGIVLRVGSDGKYTEHIDGPFYKDIENLSSYKWPTLSPEIDVKAFRNKVHNLQKQWYVFGDIANPFRVAWQLRGMENHLMDYYLNQDFLSEVYDNLYRIATDQVKLLATVDVDCICITGDIATQLNLILKPDMWRQFDKPRMAKLVEEARKIKPSVDFFFHSDGEMSSVMDDFIEIGFNIINPIQPECMDAAELRRKYGNKVVLHGCATCQGIAEMTSPQITQHVNGIIESCGMNGGLILMPSNIVPYDTPLQNVIDFCDAAKNFNLHK